MILFLITILILSLMYGVSLLKNKELSTKEFNYLGLFFLFIGSIIFFFIYNTYTSKNYSNEVMLEFCLMLGIFTFLVIILIKYIVSEKQTQSNQKALDDLKMYTDNLEKIYDDMRVFKHDYMNIISTLSYYIEEENMDDLKSYFSENIVPLSSQIKNNNHKIGLLKNIQEEELKGLVAVKLIQAQQKEIDVFVDIADKTDLAHLDKIKLCKMIGILLDNAIEAAEKSKEKRFEFGIITEDNSSSIIIRNSIESENINLQKIFRKGYSSKGENRGLGLYIVRTLISEDNNISLDTQSENFIFTQKITFKK
ncbi:MAG: sensor histidine kinase [Sarcina sp.]